MIFVYISLAVIAAALIVCFSLVFVIFKKTLGRCETFPDVFIDGSMDHLHIKPDHLEIMREGRRKVDALPKEEIYITSHDGLKLYGRLVEVKEAKATVILFHGFRSCTDNDFSSVLWKYTDMGMNVLMITHRAHGKSEGKYISMAVNESRDCVKWAEYTANRFGNDMPIILEGISMGASTVLMACDKPMPSSVKGIIADCGFTSPEEIFCHVARRNMHLPVKLLMPIFRLYFKLFAHAKTTEISALDTVKNTKIPILFIHGEDDDFVPYAMGVKLNEACASPHKFISVPGAGHGQSYLVNPEKCDEALKEFLAKVI
ncbi:MAG: alpha/beta hydrolase [Clostridia bacterium]|nr:alpha/beta hydrolase [Clostridia bacterium]